MDKSHIYINIGNLWYLCNVLNKYDFHLQHKIKWENHNSQNIVAIEISIIVLMDKQKSKM